jgi:hypothetical protein
MDLTPELFIIHALDKKVKHFFGFSGRGRQNSNMRALPGLSSVGL